jgi:hypothetical protein
LLTLKPHTTGSWLACVGGSRSTSYETVPLTSALRLDCDLTAVTVTVHVATSLIAGSTPWRRDSVTINSGKRWPSNALGRNTLSGVQRVQRRGCQCSGERRPRDWAGAQGPYGTVAERREGAVQPAAGCENITTAGSRPPRPPAPRPTVCASGLAPAPAARHRYGRDGAAPGT